MALAPVVRIGSDCWAPGNALIDIIPVRHGSGFFFTKCTVLPIIGVSRDHGRLNHNGTNKRACDSVVHFYRVAKTERLPVLCI